MTEAVVFDLDGVLLDSEQVWDDVREQLARERGGRWHAGCAGRHDGHELASGRATCTTSSASRSARGDQREVVRRMLERYATGLPLIDGAVDAVHGLAPRFQARRRLVVEPAADRRGARSAGVEDLFAATVSSEEVARGKPAPDVYLEAARRLAVAPHAAVAIEDSANGIARRTRPACRWSPSRTAIIRSPRTHSRPRRHDSTRWRTSRPSCQGLKVEGRAMPGQSSGPGEA